MAWRGGVRNLHGEGGGAGGGCKVGSKKTMAKSNFQEHLYLTLFQRNSAGKFEKSLFRGLFSAEHWVGEITLVSREIVIDVNTLLRNFHILAISPENTLHE